jgi:hypothetical protein
MKKFSLVLGLFVILFIYGKTTALAANSACITIWRTQGNVKIASNCANTGPFTFPNDRVARGASYRVVVSYNTNNTGIYVETYKKRVLSPFFVGYFDTSHYTIDPGTSFSWTDTVPYISGSTAPVDPNFKDVYFDVQAWSSSTVLSSLRLPIG